MFLFIKNLLKLLFICCAVILIIEILLSKIISNNVKFHINSNPKYIVLGHSHTECAFNDSLICNFKNLSNSGESYFYTYYKLKKILEQNPSIQVVFIGFSNNQIEKEMDNWIWGDKYLNRWYPDFAPFIDFQGTFLLFMKNFSGYLNTLGITIRHQSLRVITNNYNFNNLIGSYLFLTRQKTDSILTESNLVNNKRERCAISVSQINLIYLKKCIELCRTRRVATYLIRSPLHFCDPSRNYDDYYFSVKESFFLKTVLLDFADFPISNEEFGDLTHLNFRGAVVFSNWFNKFLQSHKSNDNIFYDSGQHLILDTILPAAK